MDGYRRRSRELLKGYVSHQDCIMTQPKPKVSFEDTYDESVDAKAASYISKVQERFKLERLNSERRS
ncbi:hypothetical protein G2W53_040834 [Senna tora]|uniref:Uncharacterized protein n=1 Tax=Senna tora TaxID=362788 RepID=A0A834VXI6_9FABA|nr:hypothetical protein G2W53_040834 [Senna tora]